MTRILPLKLIRGCLAAATISRIVAPTVADAGRIQQAGRRCRFVEAPAPKASINGEVALKTGEDPSFQPAGVVYEILVDGKSLFRITPPEAIKWDSRTVADGPHVVQLVRKIPSDGKSFRETYREEIPVTVANGKRSAAASNTSSQFESIDRHALAAPANSESSTTALAEYLTSTARNETEKARAIYRWMTGRIRWAHDEGVNPGQPTDARPAAVLERRTAECLGFAMLFEQIARQAGLDVVSIHGYARSDGSTAADYAANPSRFNHWWNGVKLEGKWRLIDCGWSVRGDDGSTASSDRGPVHLLSYYFLVPSDQLIYTHFPLDSKWQLVDHPMSFEDQARLPYVRSDLFRLGLTLPSGVRSPIRGHGGFALKIGAPEDVVMSGVLYRGSAPVTRMDLRERQDGSYMFPFARVSPGEYRLSLFAKKRDEPGYYRGVADFSVTID